MKDNKLKLFRGIILTILAFIVLYFGFVLTFATIYPVELKVKQGYEELERVHKINYIELDDVPEEFQEAIIRTEDRRFYSHFGFDIIGFSRAMLTNIKTGEFSQGGSTITQQLIRNTILDFDKNVVRKVKEAVLAIALEQFMDKEEILELYINVINYGHGAFGLNNAAEIYFGKEVEDLTIAELTLLAGIPNSPTNYDPYKSMELAKKRQKQILINLVDEEVITEEEASKIYNEPIILKDS